MNGLKRFVIEFFYTFIFFAAIGFGCAVAIRTYNFVMGV